LVQDEAFGSIDVCAIVFGQGCDDALISDGSWQLGVPLAGWGVVYFGSLGCLLMMGWVLGDEFRGEATIGALLLSVLGVVVSVILTIVIASGRAPFCGLCLVIHAANVALLPSLKRLSGGSIREIASALSAGSKYLVGGDADEARSTHWKAVGFVTAGLVATVLYQWVLVQSERRLARNYAAVDDMVLARFERTPRQEVPVDRRDASLGPAAAPAQLVVFSSFQCPGCRALSGELYGLQRRFPSQLRIVFKHFPLGKECNDAVKSDLQPLACAAARAAVSAHQQDRFWSFHDALFASNLKGGETALGEIAASVGLDQSQFDQVRSAAHVDEQIREDVQLGSQLGVDATPALFLNGRRVRHLSARSLELLVRSEVEASQRAD
jgi:protein-disulfide isomerase